MTELSKSWIEEGTFFLGQLELKAIVQKIIRTYRFFNNNRNPELVVIPFLSEVDGVKVDYESGEPATTDSANLEARPTGSKPSKPHSKGNSES